MVPEPDAEPARTSTTPPPGAPLDPMMPVEPLAALADTVGGQFEMVVAPVPSLAAPAPPPPPIVSTLAPLVTALPPLPPARLPMLLVVPELSAAVAVLPSFQ